MTDPICPRCRGTGIARVALYLVGLRDGDLHTMTACDCPAGKAIKAATKKKHPDRVGMIAHPGMGGAALAMTLATMMKGRAQ